MIKSGTKSASMLTNLGAIIALERGNRGYSQVQLADRALIHRTYLSNIERGEQKISLRPMSSERSVYDVSGPDNGKMAPEVGFEPTTK